MDAHRVETPEAEGLRFRLAPRGTTTALRLVAVEPAHASIWIWPSAPRAQG